MSHERPLYQRQHRRNAVKLGVFATVMLLVLVALAVVFSQVTFTSTDGYHATFTDASGMTAGSKVRIAGVPVGSVKGVRVGKDNLARVDFDVESKYRLLHSTRAAIRYENLVGDRYLELMEGPGSPARLAPGSTISRQQTAPALDLDQLLGGFKPLLRGLDPGQTNALTAALVQVFQGQGQTLVSLLSSTGEFTKTLADRDKVIGEVIENLNTVLQTVAARGEQFSTTIDQLQQLISGLAGQRDPIGAAIPRIADATGGLARLLSGSRPDVAADVDQLGRTAAQLNSNDTLPWVLENLPEAYRKLTRIGSYGSFLQLYICGTKAKFIGPDGREQMLTFGGGQTTGRCAP